MWPRPYLVAASTAILVLPVFVYYVFRKKHKSSPTEQSIPEKAISDEQISEKTISNAPTPVIEFTFKKEHVTPDTAKVLHDSLNTPDVSTQNNALLMIQQSAAFTSNYSVLRESGCLDSMLNLFEISSKDSSGKNRQNLCILQTLTNMVCDPACLEVIMDHLDTIMRVAFNLEYSDEACAALQVLCNLALTPTGCRVLDARLPELFAMLETTDQYMLRQVFSVLLNLSCDPKSCDLILEAEVPDHLVHRITDCLSASTQPLVLLQLVNLLRNLYKGIGLIEDDQVITSDSPSTRDFLVNSRTALKTRVQFILSEPSIVDTNQELARQAESLLSQLTNPELPVV